MPSLIVHCHFYQPPRENPCTGEVDPQPSAAPFANWNERITIECYRPNGAARIVRADGRVVALVDNYQRISYDVGPTLMSWLERHNRGVYARVLGGAGAIAQAYNHSILPLCSDRDLRTQVRWGLADFARRYGRRAAGMWLPECAVDERVMAVLAEEGVGFTILAPHQVRADVSAPAYRWQHPSNDGRGVDVLVYDGDLSRAAAFDLTQMTSEELVERALEAAGDGVATIAVDGETFGHHQAWGDRLLAYALAVDAPRRGLAVTTPAEWLAAHPPPARCDVIESSWSCEHGLERWRSDCGCASETEEGWTQGWRAQLRAALDHLKSEVDAAFESVGTDVLGDPWAARDAALDESGSTVAARSLLEAERQAMAMFTSCGWFFADLAGIETVQVLRHADRAAQLMAEIGSGLDVKGFLALLSEAKSNDPDEGDGAEVWDRHVVPARVTSQRVAAHVGLAHARGMKPGRGVLAGHSVEVRDATERRRSNRALAVGELVIEDLATGRGAIHRYDASQRGDRGPEVVVDGRHFSAADDLPAQPAPTSNDVATALLRRLIEAALEVPHDRDPSIAAIAILDECERLELRPDIEPFQEALYNALTSGGATPGLESLGARLGLAVGSLGLPG